MVEPCNRRLVPGFLFSTSPGIGRITVGPSHPGSGTVSFNGSWTQTIGGSSPTSFNGLAVNNSAGVSLAVNTNVAGGLNLASGDITTRSNTLFQNVGSTSSGTFDVVGNVNRSGTDVAVRKLPRDYGNTFVELTVTAAVTGITNINVNLVKSFPNDFSNAVSRTYTITQNGGTGVVATVQLHYSRPDDSELNGNTEASLEIWRKLSGGMWVTQAPATARNATDNFVSRTAVAFFTRQLVRQHGRSPLRMLLQMSRSSRSTQNLLTARSS